MTTRSGEHRPDGRLSGMDPMARAGCGDIIAASRSRTCETASVGDVLFRLV